MFLSSLVFEDFSERARRMSIWTGRTASAIAPNAGAVGRVLPSVSPTFSHAYLLLSVCRTAPLDSGFRRNDGGDGNGGQGLFQTVQILLHCGFGWGVVFAGADVFGLDFFFDVCFDAFVFFDPLDGFFGEP